MKKRKGNHLTRQEKKQKFFEEKRLKAFKHFMAAHFEEIYCNDYFNEFLIKPTVN